MILVVVGKVKVRRDKEVEGACLGSLGGVGGGFHAPILPGWLPGFSLCLPPMVAGVLRSFWWIRAPSLFSCCSFLFRF